MSDFEKALSNRVHELYKCNHGDRPEGLSCSLCGTDAAIYRIAARWAREWFEQSLKDLRSSISNSNRAQEKLRLDNAKLRGALEWLGGNHDVDTSTKQRSDYWANQFKLATEIAEQALKETGGDE